MTTLYTVLASLPFLFIPGIEGEINIFAPRHLYFGLAGISILLVIILNILYKGKRRKIYIFLNLFLVLLLFWGTVGNVTKIYSLVSQGQIRNMILKTIYKENPELPNKVVFYTESDSSYYGLPEATHILPYQSGFGQTLLVYYYQHTNIPKDFLGNGFLWEIKDEGYMEIGDIGYGYFINFEELKKTFVKYQLSKESVIAYAWESKTNKLINITARVRRDLLKK
jgi:hypothetical protein